MMILRGSVFSEQLEMESGITVISPDKPAAGPYHVVYLLHGLCGRSGDWADYTLLPNYARNYNALFVMPDAARSFYSDMKYGLNYFSYITDELPLICKSIFNISAERQHTAIIGASMGGYGALKCALAKPLQYGYCAAFSSPCLLLKENLQRAGGSENFKKMNGEHLLRDFQAILGENIRWNPREDVVELALAMEDRETIPKLYLACGTDDPLYGENKKFQEIIREAGFGFVSDEWQGSHDWYFFDEALKRALHFCFGAGQNPDE